MKLKRKDVGEEYLLGAPLGSRTGTPVVRLQDMPPSEGGGGEDGNWARTYYEQHPISAAANAMLNIGGPGGGNPEEQAQNMGGLIYEYYKFSGLSVGDKDKIEIWPISEDEVTLMKEPQHFSSSSAPLPYEKKGMRMLEEYNNKNDIKEEEYILARKEGGVTYTKRLGLRVDTVHWKVVGT
uniref:Uncharacterized protein n=1 Tax=Timema douglasi TaxID=61478 RepID=A0A7R8VE00_TIMDO|nr:unnamed protein product [Timema douglasi]